MSNEIRDLFADKERCLELGRGSRAIFENEYDADVNYQRLLDIYQQADLDRRL